MESKFKFCFLNKTYYFREIRIEILMLELIKIPPLFLADTIMNFLPHPRYRITRYNILKKYIKEWNFYYISIPESEASTYFNITMILYRALNKNFFRGHKSI